MTHCFHHLYQSSAPTSSATTSDRNPHKLNIGRKQQKFWREERRKEKEHTPLIAIQGTNCSPHFLLWISTIALCSSLTLLTLYLFHSFSSDHFFRRFSLSLSPCRLMWLQSSSDVTPVIIWFVKEQKQYLKVTLFIFPYSRLTQT